jgi:hypothetical protein
LSRTGILLFVVLALLAFTPAAFADTRFAVQGDPLDAPRSALDLEQVRVNHDRDRGALSVTFRFHGPVPDAQSYGDRVKAVIGRKCTEYPTEAGEAEIGFSSGYGSPHAWAPAATTRGTVGSNSPAASLEFSPDRREVTVATTDSLLAGADDRCVEVSSEWSEAPYDPNSPSGPVEDSTTSFYFEGFECQERPNLTVDAPPRVAYGAWAPVTVESTDSEAALYDGKGKLVFADAASAKPFFEYQFDDGDDEALWAGKTVGSKIRLDPGDGPAVIGLSWTQNGGRLCGVLRKVVGIRGSQPRVKLRGGSEEGTLSLDSGRRCWLTRAGAVKVTFALGRRRRTYRLADPCAKRWKATPRRLSGLSVRAEPYSYGSADLTIGAVATRRFRVTVSVAGRSVLHRRMQTVHRHHKAYRVFAFHPNGRTNDEYWNWCVNEGRQTYMRNGNAFCWSPAYTDASVRFKR